MTLAWLTHNGGGLAYNGKGLALDMADPYNPLNLPPYTFRCQYVSGFTPDYSGCTAVQVSSSPNVWDITKVENPANMSGLFQEPMYHSALWKILGANTTGVTDMSALISGCLILTEICLFDTRSVTDMHSFAYSANKLKTIPAFPTGSVTNFYYAFGDMHGLTRVPMLDLSSAQNMEYAFGGTPYVEGGALDLYNVAAARMPAIANHARAFEECGWTTTTGAAELAQIPESWGGTLPD